MRWRSLTACITALIMPTLPLSAQVIDQQQTTLQWEFGGLSGGWALQSFRPTASNSVGAGFLLWNRYNVSTPTTATIQLWSGMPSTSGSAMLASASATFSMANGEQRWFDLFWSPVTLTPGNTYYLGISGTTWVQTVYGQFGSYADGNANYNYASAITSPYANLWGNFDFAFRTYAASPVVPVPEPTGALLIAGGLLGIGVARRRRRSVA